MNTQDRKAERNTDDACAIHIMGWLWQETDWGVMNWFNAAGREVGFGNGDEWRLFKPSTSIAHAWIVLEHFTWPKFYTRLVRTDTGNWRCDIELNGGDGPVRSAYAETAALAICRAALVAVGVDK